jgi:hypothetical protein
MWRFRKLNLDQFLRCGVVDENPLNHLVRREHFDIFRVVAGELTVGNIVTLVETPQHWKTVLERERQPQKCKIGDLPIHLNLDFWTNGNSYFLNVMRAGFRQNVVAYEHREEWEQLVQIPFSDDYYQSCSPMNDTAIAALLRDNPISLRNGAFASGRHRVFAMIGRLARGQEYIPFYVDRLA